MKHWTHFLPEAGKAIRQEGETIMSMRTKYAEAQEIVLAMKNSIAEAEKSLYENALKNWSEKEIRAAKSRATDEMFLKP